MVLFMGPPNSTKCAYSCIFGFHNTIHTFKNDFASVFSTISFQFLAIRGIQKDPICLDRCKQGECMWNDILCMKNKSFLKF